MQTQRGCDLKAERRKTGAQHRAQKIGCDDTDGDADDGEQSGLAKHNGDDGGAAGTHGLEDADLAGALHHGGVHGLKDDEEADDDGDTDDDTKSDVEAGHALRRELRDKLFGGLDAPIFEAGRERISLRTASWYCGGVFGADIEDGGFAGVAVDVRPWW